MIFSVITKKGFSRLETFVGILCATRAVFWFFAVSDIAVNLSLHNKARPIFAIKLHSVSPEINSTLQKYVLL